MSIMFVVPRSDTPMGLPAQALHQAASLAVSWTRHPRIGPLRDDVHAVIIVVPFNAEDLLIEDCARRITAEGLRARLVTEYTRDLPQALCGLPETQPGGGVPFAWGDVGR